jgi:two-component system LytT family response regulator
VSGPRLRVVIADDERPARSFLAALLATFDDVSVVGEAANGSEAIEAIERERPDLALLDLQMPEVDGLGVVRLVDADRMPLVAFVTAYDEYAVRAFEVNAIDYLLKPVDRARLAETLERARARREVGGATRDDAERVRSIAAGLASESSLPYLERVPVRDRDGIVLLPVAEIVSVVAEGELLHLATRSGARFTITYRLKDLEARLDSARFVRLSRGALASISAIERISPMPGGTYVVTLVNGQELAASRTQSRVLRDQLLKL